MTSKELHATFLRITEGSTASRHEIEMFWSQFLSIQQRAIVASEAYEDLRDQFAKSVASGFCAASDGVHQLVGDESKIAEASYRVADAMLAARKTSRETRVLKIPSPE